MLSGRVLGRGGDPAPDAVVELHNSSGDVVDQVRVDSTARYRFHLSEGVWFLRSWDSSGGRAAGRAVLGTREDVNLDLNLEPASVA